MHRPASGSAGFTQRRAESSGTSNYSAASVGFARVHLALHPQNHLILFHLAGEEVGSATYSIKSSTVNLR